MGNNLTSCNIHIIFATKKRKESITNDFSEELFSFFSEKVKKEKGEVISIGGAKDHIHLLVSLNPTKALSLFIRAIKTESSKWINDNYPAARYFSWQSGYCAFSVSYSKIEKVKNYIQSQESYHEKAGFKEEITLFLKKHGVSFDPRYI